MCQQGIYQTYYYSGVRGCFCGVSLTLLVLGIGIDGGITNDTET